jgi:hypothetical protein
MKAGIATVTARKLSNGRFWGNLVIKISFFYKFSLSLHWNKLIGLLFSLSFSVFKNPFHINHQNL